MKVAVTGAGGFIGRYVLTELLQRDDIDVISVIRTRIPAGIDSERIRIVQLDMSVSPDKAYDLLDRPDVLIHLAWSGLPNYKSMHHIDSELVNQYKFLSQLLYDGLPALVCTGTCLEYGLQCGELREDGLVEPRYPYAVAKDALRRMLECLAETIDIRMVWTRLFYMYGEGQAHSALYSQLNAAIASGARSFEMSRGEQLRDYLHVKEVARYLVALSLQATARGVINVCSGRPISVRRLVEQWVSAAGGSLELRLGERPYPDYEPLAFWGSNVRLQNVLSTAAQSEK